MNNSEIIALSKAVAAKAASTASSKLETGDHEVDFLVRIHGTFKKGEDYNQKFVAAADPWGLLAVALSKLNGVTVDSLVTDHLDLDKETKDQIKAQANAALQAVKGPTWKPANGKVSSVKLAVEQMDVSSEAVESSEVA